MSAFTRLGACLWDWRPFLDLDDSSRVLWFALYTTGESKRHAPGLWQGGIPTMADASHQHPDTVISALDQLLERGLVEYDNRARVLRLCELPDAGEFPSNGKVILSWWTRFRSVPECGVRDAHVTTLRWILETGARSSGKGISVHHESAWRDTFGTVVVPAPRHRGVRRLADSDTSTSVQPCLFSSEQPSGYGFRESAYPQAVLSSVDKSAVLRQSNQIKDPETVSDTVSDTNRIPDPGSRILDPSGEGGRGGGHESGRPDISLVPHYTTGHVLRALALGPWDATHDRSCWDAVGAMIPTWVASGLGLAEFAVLAQYNEHAQRRWSARVLLGCDISAEVALAQRSIDWRDVQTANRLQKIS